MSVITRLTLIASLLVACFALPSAAFANSIAPEAFDLNLRPGETGEYVLSIFNSEASSVSFHADVVPLVLDQKNGGIAIDTKRESTSWIELSESRFVLAPDQQKEITVRITVPQDADAQVVSVGIRVLEDSTQSTGTGITSGFISLLFLTVDGVLNESYEILAFETSNKIITTLPVTFTLTLRNDGERIVQPVGTIQFIDLFGKLVWSADVNEDLSRILPGSARAFSRSLTNDDIGFLLPGVYTVKVQAAAWPLGEEFTQELTVVYLPWRGLIVVGLFLAAFFLILKKLNVSRRRL